MRSLACCGTRTRRACLDATRRGDGGGARARDPITTVALLFVAIVTPAEIAFTLNDDVDMLSPLFFINRAFDVIFLKDMVMQFFVAYIDTAVGARRPISDWRFACQLAGWRLAAGRRGLSA